MLALALALSFFSFSAMFVAAVLMLDIALFRAPRGARLAWLGALGAFTAAWGALYVLLFKPATHFQFVNYPQAYAENTLLARVGEGPGAVFETLALAFEPAFFPVALGVGLLGLAIAAALRGRLPGGLSLRAGVGGGTRACGFAGARGARLCTVVLCTPWMYVEVRMYSVDCIACFRILGEYICKNIREREQ